MQQFELSEDGIDKHFAVTHLAHFLLINRLLPLLRRTPPASQDLKPPCPPSSPRIISLTSTLHTAASPTVLFLTNAELSRESSDSSSPLALFARAALSAVLFTKRLALQLSFSARAPGTRPLLALAVDPGPVQPGQPEQYKEAFGYVLGSAASAVRACAPERHV